MDNEPKEIVIGVESVTKTFKLPHEKYGTLKSSIIHFWNKNKGFEVQKALKNVSFSVEKGDFFAIVGRNGGGKSTMLKLLAGIYVPTEGKIHVLGKITPFIELGVGFNPELTGRENVYLNGALLGFNRKEMSAMYDDIVSFAELKRFMDQKLKNYSSGMQVRLAFSIAIRAKGDILLLDEVLAVGDAAFQQKCYDYFEELKEQKKTVVFVSHDMTAVTRFCNKAIFIKNGELVLAGSPLDVADYYTQENISQEETVGSPKKSFPANGEISAEVVNQTDDKVTIEFSFHTKVKGNLHISMSLLSGGMAVGGITTPEDMKLSGHGKVVYEIKTTELNAGAYQVGIGLYKHDNRQLLAAGKKKCQFAIKGKDLTKDGALKLPDTWRKRD